MWKRCDTLAGATVARRTVSFATALTVTVALADFTGLLAMARARRAKHMSILDYGRYAGV